MSRVQTNKCSLAFAIETSTPGVLGGSPTWFKTEPNDISDLGAKITTVARRPISRSRQLKQGTVVDLDSAVAFEADLTMDAASKFLEDFIFAEYANQNLYFFAPPAVSGVGFTIPTSTANQAAKAQFTAGGPISLFFVRGYLTASINGLKALTSDLAGGVTTLPITTIGANETPPTNAVVEYCGIRTSFGGGAGDLAITVSAGAVTLTSGGGSGAHVDFTTLGIKPGQFIHVGGLTSTNQMPTGSIGFFRVLTVAAGVITGDKVFSYPGTSLTTDPNTSGGGKAVDLLFGRFLRDVPNDQNVDDTRYIERTKTYEAAYPDLGGAGVDGYEYPIANYGNSVTLDIPETNKVTLKLEYLGFDTPIPTGVRKTNAANAINPIGTVAFNSSTSFVNLRTDALTAPNTLFKSISMKITNNLAPDKILGILGAAVMDIGQFVIELDSELIFADVSLPTAIRNNSKQTLDLMLKNSDGGIVIDLPSVTIGDGGKTFPVDKAVKISSKFMPFGDANLGNSLGISLFPVLP